MTATLTQMTDLPSPVALDLFNLPDYREKLITYTDDDNGWATHRQGFILRRTPDHDTEFPNHLIIVSKDEGFVRFVPLNQIRIRAVSQEVPLQVHNQIGLLAWEKRNVALRNLEGRRELAIAQRELEKWDEKVSKACEEADRRGYCSEFERIAEAAGIDVPEPQEFEIECSVTITVTVTKEARTEEKARELVEYDDISSKISGEDSIDDWELKD